MKKIFFFGFLLSLISLSVLPTAVLAGEETPGDCLCRCVDDYEPMWQDNSAACSTYCSSAGGMASCAASSNSSSGSSNCDPSGLTLCNPLGDVDSPQALIGRVINSVLGLVGSIALLMFVYGGLIWMTSSGNQEKVKKGRDIIIWSSIGLAVIFISYALTKVVLTTLVQ